MRRKSTTMKKSDYQSVIYDDFCGIPLQVTFLNNQWWVSTPGMKLQLLKDYGKDLPGINFNYLCEAQGSVGTLALARLLGKAVEEPEDTLDKVMDLRVKTLRRLGVKLNVNDEVLQLELRVFAHGEKSKRQGQYSVWCHTADNFYDMLFDIDCFDKKADAEEWANVYFTFLRSIGIKLEVINKEK